MLIGEVALVPIAEILILLATIAVLPTLTPTSEVLLKLITI
jgi:hypothetical protein